MKKIMLVPFICVLLFFNSCTKKDTDCKTWNNSIIDGKTFIITKIELMTTNEDVTQEIFNSTPCFKNKFVFNASNYTQVKSSNCTDSIGSYAWSTKNDIENILVLNGKNLQVQSFDCTKFIIKNYYLGGTASSLAYITFTKQ